MLHSSGYRDPKLPHPSIELPQPRSPQSYSPCGDERPPCFYQVNRLTLFPPRLEVQLQEELPSGGHALGLSTILRQKAAIPLPNSSRPMSVWMVDSRCGHRLRWFLRPDRALRKLVTSKGTWEAYPSSGSQGGAFPSSISHGGARQHCSRRGLRNDGGVFGHEFGRRRGPRPLAAW